MKAQTAAELVGRLNPRSTALEVSGKNIFALTSLDVAAAIGMMKLELDRLWLHVIYAHHTNLADKLEISLLEHVVNGVYHERWPTIQPGFLRGMIWTSVAECVSQPICPTCNGAKQTLINQEEADYLNTRTGMQYKAGQPVLCEGCDGGGFSRKSNYWRSQMCGMHHDLWSRNKPSWNDRYERALDLVRLVDDRAKGAVGARLSY